MKRTVQSFGELIEKYVLSVADKFIELADKDNQTRLINLINKIDSSIPAYGLRHVATGSQVDSSPDTTRELPVSIYTKGLEEQWQAALRLPVPQETVENCKHITTIERLIAFHQTNIDFTMGCILKIDKLLERAEENITDAYRNRIMIHHYQVIKKRYIVYIAKLQALQEKELIKLEQYQ